MLFEGLEFDVGPAEVLQIEGENGSGKTSLIRIIAGLRRPDEGRVSWNDKDIFTCRHDYARDMAYFGHLPSIKEELNCRENITALLHLRGLECSVAEIDPVLDFVGLFGFEDVSAKALSSGQKRRVLFAALRLSKSRLWILDEPLTALDAQGVELVESMINEHRGNGGSVIFTTHHGMQMTSDMRSIHLGDVLSSGGAA